MGWKYNWIQWKYYHCKDELANKYRFRLQQELGKNFAGKETGKVNRRKRNIRIVVSLTSIPDRLPYAHYPIRCMLRQTVKPDKIVLYLDKNRLTDDDIPAELYELKKNGLDIVYVDDLGPHTKYFYALQTYNDCYVITIDDDTIYNRTLIRELLQAECKHRGSVCARRVRAYRFTQQGIPYPYSSYKELIDKFSYTGKHLLALGVGGVLYPPHCLNPADFELDNMHKLAHNNDDIWLRAMELLNGIEVVKAKGRGYRDLFVQKSQDIALCKENHAYGNDDIIKAVFTHFDLCRHFVGSNWIVDMERDTIIRRILTEWLTLYQKKLFISDFLLSRGIHKVAIYGMAKLGILLKSELEEKGIEVKYGIDTRGVNNVSLPIYKPEEICESVDLIIITAVTDFLALQCRLRQYTDCRMEMLEDIIAEIFWENT